MTLEQLRALLRQKHGALAALKARAFSEDAKPDEVKAFEDAIIECEGIELKIDLAEREEALTAKATKPADAPVAGIEADVTAEPERKLTPKERVSLMVKAVARAKRLGGDGKLALKILDEAGFGNFAGEIERATQKALTEGTAADGGYLVPTNLSREFIPLLREKSVIMSSGPRLINMRGLPNLTIPGQASGATASYVGEAQPIAAAQPAFKTVTLNLKKLAGIVPISNELLSDAVFDCEEQVTDDLIEQINLTGDLQMLRGTGSATAPTGILNLVSAGQKFAANATVNVVNVIADLTKALVKMRTAKVPVTKPVWIMAPEVFGYLSSLRDTGMWVFPEMRGENPTLMSIPVKQTTFVPTNLGAGTNESEIYLIDFAHVFVGDAGEVVITASDVATVVISSTPVSAFQNDLTYVRGIVRHDIDMRYLEAAVIVQSTRWGT